MNNLEDMYTSVRVYSVKPHVISFSESVFGCHIAHLCERQKTTVPVFVSSCIAAIEKRGNVLFKVICDLFTFCILDRVS